MRPLKPRQESAERHTAGQNGETVAWPRPRSAGGAPRGAGGPGVLSLSSRCP